VLGPLEDVGLPACGAFAIYSAEFFETVIAQLASRFEKTVSEAIRTLEEGFNVALNEASQFIANAGYAFPTWITGITSWLNEVLDHPCVIEISNQGNVYDLVRDSYGIGHGNWAIEPQQTIPAGAVGRFWLRDPKPTTDGSDRWARYGYIDQHGVPQTVRFDFSDPSSAFSPNVAEASSSAFGFYTKSGSVTSTWSAQNVVITGGHPFYAAYIWGNAPAPS
jgi:hypothetical protein